MSEFDSTVEPAVVEDPRPASLLDLAQKLHDDYVEKGREEAARIVSEAQNASDAAQVEHDRLVSEARDFNELAALEARNQAMTIVESAEKTSFAAIREAELKARAIIAEAEDTKSELEATILKLREFEEAYRHNLKTLAEGALETLGFTIADVTTDESDLQDETVVTEDHHANLEDSKTDMVSEGGSSDREEDVDEIVTEEVIEEESTVVEVELKDDDAHDEEHTEESTPASYTDADRKEDQ